MKIRTRCYDRMTLKALYRLHKKRGIDIILGNGKVDTDTMDQESKRKRALAAKTT